MGFVVNSDLIKFVEEAPDTLITLVNGEKMIVRESAQDIIDRIVQFRREAVSGPAVVNVLPDNIADQVGS